MRSLSIYIVRAAYTHSLSLRTQPWKHACGSCDFHRRLLPLRHYNCPPPRRPPRHPWPQASAFPLIHESPPSCCDLDNIKRSYSRQQLLLEMLEPARPPASVGYLPTAFLFDPHLILIFAVSEKGHFDPQAVAANTANAKSAFLNPRLDRKRTRHHRPLLTNLTAGPNRTRLWGPLMEIRTVPLIIERRHRFLQRRPPLPGTPINSYS